MRKMLLAAVLLLASVAVSAQESAGSLTLQPKAGLNISSLMDWNRVKVGYCAGAELEYRITEGFSLSAAALYSEQGGCDKNSKKTTTLSLGYLNIPLMASLYVVKGLALKVGVQGGIRVRAAATDDGMKADVGPFIDDYFHVLGDNVQLSKYIISIPIGLSYEWKNAVFDMRYIYGMTSYVTSADPLRNNVFQFTLGYKLLGKK